MVKRSPKDAGQLVLLYNGKSAGRYFCATPRCPSSISAHTREVEQQEICFSCLTTGAAWFSNKAEQGV